MKIVGQRIADKTKSRPMKSAVIINWFLGSVTSLVVSVTVYFWVITNI